MSDEKRKFNLSAKLKDFKGEYKKIIWPDFKSLCKQTCTVMFTCLFFGAIIFCMDATYGFCSNYIINFLSK